MLPLATSTAADFTAFTMQEEKRQRAARAVEAKAESKARKLAAKRAEAEAAARAEAEAAARQQAEKEAAAAEAEKKAAGLAKLLDTLHSVASERGMRLPSLNGPFFHRLDLSWRDLNHTNVLTGDKLETFLLGLLGPRGLGLSSTDLVSPNPNPNPNPTLS